MDEVFGGGVKMVREIRVKEIFRGGGEERSARSELVGSESEEVLLGVKCS